MMTACRETGRGAAWAARVAIGCVIFTMLIPLTALAAPRVVLMEEFTATW